MAASCIAIRWRSETEHRETQITWTPPKLHAWNHLNSIIVQRRGPAVSVLGPHHQSLVDASPQWLLTDHQESRPQPAERSALRGGCSADSSEGHTGYRTGRQRAITSVDFLGKIAVFPASRVANTILHGRLGKRDSTLLGPTRLFNHKRQEKLDLESRLSTSHLEARQGPVSRSLNGASWASPWPAQPCPLAHRSRPRDGGAGSPKAPGSGSVHPPHRPALPPFGHRWPLGAKTNTLSGGVRHNVDGPSTASTITFFCARSKISTARSSASLARLKAKKRMTSKVRCQEDEEKHRPRFQADPHCSAWSTPPGTKSRAAVSHSSIIRNDVAGWVDPGDLCSIPLDIAIAAVVFSYRKGLGTGKRRSLRHSSRRHTGVLCALGEVIGRRTPWQRKKSQPNGSPAGKIYQWHTQGDKQVVIISLWGNVSSSVKLKSIALPALFATKPTTRALAARRFYPTYPVGNRPLFMREADCIRLFSITRGCHRRLAQRAHHAQATHHPTPDRRTPC
ncbi:hypothetical protein GGTG_11836 [Gaeumannomyces tritici R3-111a-1]|uniref:Uncharacterized protein n=1 Tax=Gaeumannomyces tritici (strain R3-111a-1) TaxID=644352 RepID=J3PEB3_GAET3|nr:hypothetical protein GGTG_11836 [Gaeumannomyces tritici R3-111a-1]EJT70813.1 hypothetical protein GGTG_11836 [Gaeumannomyces tritici R3-111a-1]